MSVPDDQEMRRIIARSTVNGDSWWKLEILIKDDSGSVEGLIDSSYRLDSQMMTPKSSLSAFIEASEKCKRRWFALMRTR